MTCKESPVDAFTLEDYCRHGKIFHNSIDIKCKSLNCFFSVDIMILSESGGKLNSQLFWDSWSNFPDSKSNSLKDPVTRITVNDSDDLRELTKRDQRKT